MKSSQRQRILEGLINAQGAEVPSYELGRIALQYTARIKELRKLGYVIVNRVEHRDDGSVHGFFRLDLAATKKVIPSLPNPKPAEGLLFDLRPFPD